jgi:large subunit ribosomal protein L22
MADAEAQAVARYVQVAPQKIRRILALIRGRPADEALEVLRFAASSNAGDVGKVLRSAIANAEKNHGMNRARLVVYRAFADEGPTRRWRRFGARGRFKPILRRSSHLTVILREQEGEPA